MDDKSNELIFHLIEDVLVQYIIHYTDTISDKSPISPYKWISLHEGGIIFGTVMDLRSNDAFAAYDIQIVRI